MRSFDQNPFAILGLTARATAADVLTAVRRLSLLYHPDRNLGDAQAETKFKLVQAANEALSDDRKRAEQAAKWMPRTAPKPNTPTKGRGPIDYSLDPNLGGIVDVDRPPMDNGRPRQNHFIDVYARQYVYDQPAELPRRRPRPIAPPPTPFIDAYAHLYAKNNVQPKIRPWLDDD